jgi:hypothetical protein
LMMPFFVGNLFKAGKAIAVASVFKKKEQSKKNDIQVNTTETINAAHDEKNDYITIVNHNDDQENGAPSLLRAGYVDLTNTGTLYIQAGTIVSDEGSFVISPTGTSQNAGYLYIKGDWTNNGTYVTDTGKVTFWGVDPQVIGGTTSSTIYNAVVDNIGGVTLNLSTTISNSINLVTGAVDLNSNMLSINRSSLASLSYSGGYIISEKTDNSSKVKWKMNAVTGPHVIPFGTASAQVIPLTIDITSGNMGDVTVSTYHTAPNNLPKPVTPDSVYTIIDMYGADNSNNMVDRYWQIDKSGVSGTVTITFSYLDSEIPVNGEATMNSQRYNNATHRWEVPLPGQSQSTAGNTVTTPGVTGFGAHTLVVVTSILPIELVEFNAVPDKEQVKLSWTTASEINSDYFTVQRSRDGREFEDLMKVNAAGNSTNTIHYEINDEYPLNGISYYRLKETDNDNSSNYSNIRSIEFFRSKKFVIAAYPNPAKTNFNLSITKEEDGRASISVINPVGQIVYMKDYDLGIGENLLSFKCSDWSRGVYHVRILIDESEVIEKTIVLN